MLKLSIFQREKINKIRYLVKVGGHALRTLLCECLLHLDCLSLEITITEATSQ